MVSNNNTSSPKSTQSVSSPKVGWLKRHFTDSRRRTTSKQLEREAFLFGTTPFRRLYLIPASILTQLAAGSLYAWSVYNLPLTTHMNSDLPPTSPDRISIELVSQSFYVTIAFFGIACFLCGPWLERHGPRRMSLIGATLFFIGQLIAALSMYLRCMPLLFIGYGVFAGFGIGCCYLIPVSILQQWYPENKGFSAAVSVGSFGLGSVVASFTQAALIRQVGVTLTFVVLGCTYFVVQVGAAFVMRFPPIESMLAVAAAAALEPTSDEEQVVDRVKSVQCKLPTKQQQRRGSMTPLTSTAAVANEPSMFRTPMPVVDEERGGKQGVGSTDTLTDFPTVADSKLVAANALKSPLSPTESTFSLSRTRRASIALSIAMSTHTIDDVDDFLLDIQSADYRFIYAIFFLSVIPGLVLVSRMADMVQLAFDKPADVATWVVGINGGFNVLARIVLGVLSDRVPRVLLLMLVFVVTIVATVTMYLSLSLTNFPLFLASMWTITALYGGSSAVIPGLIGDVFGNKHISGLYGVAMTARSLGGVVGGFTYSAVIKSQKEAGVAKNHVLDLTLFSMVPLSTLGAVLLTMLMVRRRRAGARK
ncbi:major facilitator superfamily domain-containing protein [Catenaria anguillulae PL171]|uniref:Major facilitator superfamily domain-containing protein n=1 Tax=Catenaria anguillulae PL171 TaxID=765915 RepID=A0A1Y2HAA3_9FUNG|nr:major facilitator superfamily domain-containing protein [Catenaria anguillulae PL171]